MYCKNCSSEGNNKFLNLVYPHEAFLVPSDERGIYDYFINARFLSLKYLSTFFIANYAREIKDQDPDKTFHEFARIYDINIEDFSLNSEDELKLLNVIHKCINGEVQDHASLQILHKLEINIDENMKYFRRNSCMGYLSCLSSHLLLNTDTEIKKFIKTNERFNNIVNYMYNISYFIIVINISFILALESIILNIFIMIYMLLIIYILGIINGDKL